MVKEHFNCWHPKKLIFDGDKYNGKDMVQKGERAMAGIWLRVLLQNVYVHVCVNIPYRIRICSNVVDTTNMCM